jgi:uncharacterized membrane protein YdbT with pleckstrin-like domain
MDLHPGEQTIFSGRPSWRSTMEFYVSGLLLSAAAGAIAAFAKSTGLGVAVGAGVFAFVLVVGLLRRIGTHYVVTNERLHIRRGLIARRSQETRLERVQNVNTNQSIVERILQIGTVDFDTAGSGDSDFAFRGVAQPERVVAAVDRALRQQAAPPPPPQPPPETPDAPPTPQE